MAKLLALTLRNDHFMPIIMSDIKEGVYDAALLLDPVKSQPYALMAPFDDEQINAARSVSWGRKQRFYLEKPFAPDDALQPELFQNTRLIVGKQSGGGAVALGSLDCCAFFNVHYPSSAIWTEALDVQYKLSLTSGFMRATRNPTHEQLQVQTRLAEGSSYLRLTRN